MDFRKVTWSKKQITLKKIVKHYKLPLIIKVVHGCLGETSDMDISKDEVFRLQQQIQERRVIACTSHREYSVPVHYGKKVKSIPVPNKQSGRGESKPVYLTELFENEKKIKLPLTVEFVRMHGVLDEPGVRHAIEGPFSLVKLLKKDYILCNRISSESIDSEVVILPVEIETEVRIAEGLQNGNKTEWNALMQEINSITEKVNFNLYRGIKDIIPINKRPRHKSDSGVDTMPQTNPVRGFMRNRRSEPTPARNTFAPPAYSQSPHTPTHRPRSRPIPSSRHLDGDVSIGNSYEPPPPYSRTRPLYEHQTTTTRELHIPNESLDRNSNVYTAPPTSRSPEPAKSTNTWSNLPEKVDDFSIADVCNSLKLLGMHSYYKMFKEKRINGPKLKTYNLDTMTKELKMSPRDAMTLDKLIERGKPSD